MHVRDRRRLEKGRDGVRAEPSCPLQCSTPLFSQGRLSEWSRDVVLPLLRTHFCVLTSVPINNDSKNQEEYCDNGALDFCLGRRINCDLSRARGLGPVRCSTPKGEMGHQRGQLAHDPQFLAFYGCQTMSKGNSRTTPHAKHLRQAR